MGERGKHLSSRIPWLLLYLVGCALEFAATWAKEHAAAKLKEPPAPPPAE